MVVKLSDMNTFLLLKLINFHKYAVLLFSINSYLTGHSVVQRYKVKSSKSTYKKILCSSFYLISTLYVIDYVKLSTVQT